MYSKLQISSSEKYEGYPYEGRIRIPTIVSMPGTVPHGVASEAPAITMDWVSTILEAAGEDADQPGLEGKSLWPILTGATQTLERDLSWHFPHYR